MASEKYYLKADFMDEEKEVTKEEYLRAERVAGFMSKFGIDHIATASFGGNGVSGRTEHIDDGELNTLTTEN